MSVSRLCRRLSILTGLAGMGGAVLSGCGGGGGSSTTPIITPPSGNYVTSGATPFVTANIASRGVCQANPHQAGRARWTVLVYMNAASNLQPDSLLNVAQMASVGSNADLNIVLQWKQTASGRFFSTVLPSTRPSFVGTRRYLIQAHSQSDVNRLYNANNTELSDTTVLDPDRLPDPATNTGNDNGTATADMGDYHTLADFVQWGAKAYPADHLAVVVWDHGSGPLSVDNRSAAGKHQVLPVRAGGRGVIVASTKNKKVTRGLSQDTQTGSQIATQQLPLALANPPQAIDALIIDCSLQGSTEIAYEVRNSARVFVGSEESPPGEGYPYDTWLAFLKAQAASPCDSGLNLINDTIAVFPAETNVTQTMVDLTKMDTVAAAVNAFGATLRNNATGQATLIQTARQNAQFYDFPELKDLYDFANFVRTASGVPSDTAAAAGSVQDSLLGTNGAILVAEHGAAQQAQAGSNGLSIFLPGPQTESSVDNSTGYDTQYDLLGFAKAAPNWVSYLKNQTK